MEPFVDCFQIGARNMQNFDLLREVGKTRKGVLLKRGLAATVKDWLLSAEYVLSQGNRSVILCERGIKTFEDSIRYSLDVTSIPVARQLSHLPIIVDPSHAAGQRLYVPALATAGMAAGAHGVIVEVHYNPSRSPVRWPAGIAARRVQGFDGAAAEDRGDLRENVCGGGRRSCGIDPGEMFVGAGATDSEEESFGELWKAVFETFYDASYNEAVADTLVSRWQVVDDLSKILVAVTASGSAFGLGAMESTRVP